MSEAEAQWGIPHDCNQGTFRNIAHSHHNALIAELDSRGGYSEECAVLRWLGAEALDQDNLVKLAHLNKKLCEALGFHSLRDVVARHFGCQFATA